MSDGVRASPPLLLQLLFHRRSKAIGGSIRRCSSSLSGESHDATGPSSLRNTHASSVRAISRTFHTHESRNPALLMTTKRQLDRFAAVETIDVHNAPSPA